MTGAPHDHPIVYLYCIAISALLLYVPGFVVAAYGRLQVGYDLRQPRTMIDRVPPYARRVFYRLVRPSVMRGQQCSDVAFCNTCSRVG